MPSQVIRRFSYDAQTRTLFIAFTSGDLYAYLDVPPQVHDAMRAAVSKGRFFAAHIRPVFAYRKMPSPGSAAPAWPPRAGAGR